MILRLLFACLVVAAVSDPVAAADPPVGRLFFTPGQRASLDIARSQRTRTAVATERTEQAVVEQPAPQTITYGGMVRRSDGQTTIWINDRAVDGGEATGGTTVVRRVGPDGAVTLEVPQSNRRVDLKVGQSVEVLSGSIGEGYRPPSTDTQDKRPAGSANADIPSKPTTRKAPPANEPERQGSQGSDRTSVEESGGATAGSR